MGRKVAKHVARNKKKYWRKISTKEIEDQLEDVRVQEMTGFVEKMFVEMFEFRCSVVVDLNNRIIFFIISIRNIRLVRVMRWKFQQHRPDRLENNVKRWI